MIPDPYDPEGYELPCDLVYRALALMVIEACREGRIDEILDEGPAGVPAERVPEASAA